MDSEVVRKKGKQESHKGKKVPHKTFSLEAQARLDRVWRQQGVLRETCRWCGFKVRGPNHEKGTHHKLRHPSMRKKGSWVRSIASWA